MCGATNQQKDILNQQTSAFKTMTDQASQVFGTSNGIVNDLVSAMSPIVAAGPGQEGFSAPEKSAMESSAITNTGLAYKHAKQAIGESQAAYGGGNIALPSGIKTAEDIDVANAGAAQTANELNKVQQADFATGRQNFFAASQALGGATSAFNPVASLDNAATAGGSAAASSANEIAQAGNAWMGALGGVVGSIGGAVVSGGMANLGDGGGFFG